VRLPPESALESDIRLRLVQPNVPQSLKWDPVQREANLGKTVALARSPGLETRTAVIWPETAVPFVVTDFNEYGPGLRQTLATATPPGGYLLTGAPRAERDAEGRLKLWNSLHVVNESASLVATYDKFHLVPFGEYVPLRSILRFAKVTVGTVDFSPGPGLETLTVPGLPPASPLICYEAIFPGRVTASGLRPAWLLNITNDAWFGMSSGPYQHFTAARFRAVEEGLPLVRAANNGISAVVDGYGRVVAQLGLGETGVLDASLPPPLGATVYSRLGDLALLGLAAILGMLALLLTGQKAVTR
jgi:apolipoprotein N-acyltransferase